VSGLYEDRFAGIARLVGADAVDKLRAAHVAVVGVGGVGSWTVEALARSGVGQLSLIDLDEICLSNINRQVHTLTSTVGQAKVDALARRVTEIQPSCKVHAIQQFFTAKSADSLLTPQFDVVVDAIDSARSKALLIAKCHEQSIEVVVCGGAGGRLDPSRLQVADLNRTKGDPLLRRIRDLLRKEHGFARSKRWKIQAIFSDESARWPAEDGSICVTGTGPGPGFRLDCASGYGAATFVTGAMGFWAAGLAVDAIVKTPSKVNET